MKWMTDWKWRAGMVPIRLKKSKLSEIRQKNIQRMYAKKEMYSSYEYGTTVRFNWLEPDKSDGANLISSKTTDGFHAPVFDLDFPVDVIPSMTEGHCHLYMNKRLTWQQYQKLLDVMVEVGLVEKEWVKTNIRWEATFVRTPAEMMKELFGVEDDDET